MTYKQAMSAAIAAMARALRALDTAKTSGDPADMAAAVVALGEAADRAMPLNLTPKQAALGVQMVAGCIEATGGDPETVCDPAEVERVVDAAFVARATEEERAMVESEFRPRASRPAAARQPIGFKAPREPEVEVVEVEGFPVRGGGRFLN